MRILLTTGGTGGHVFPAIALADELKEKYGCTILFAGGRLSKNPYFDQERFAFQEVSFGKLKKNPWHFLKELYGLIKGVRESIQLIRKFDPDAVIGFGSHYTLPIVLAAVLLKKKVYLHEANSIPGRVNKLLAPFVTKTWFHFPGTENLLKGKSAWGGMPLRADFRKGLVSKEVARDFFKLSASLPTVLIFGGSQGAEKINQLVSEAVIGHLLQLLPPFQILHFTGNSNEAERIDQLYQTAKIPAFVRPFEKRIDLAWAAADLAITRAGAASIAEQTEFEVPGLLIPFPFATDQHQDKNADHLVQNGLAIKIAEKDLDSKKLSQLVQELYLKLDQHQNKFQAYNLSKRKHSLSQQIVEEIQHANRN